MAPNNRNSSSKATVLRKSFKTRLQRQDYTVRGKSPNTVTGLWNFYFWVTSCS